MLRAVVQPQTTSTLEVLCANAKQCDIQRLDIAVAYITGSGLRELLIELDSRLGQHWKTIPKRWITSLDYMRTEPVALELACSTPNSQVRIQDAISTLQRGCIPKIPFHPKVFLARGVRSDWVLAGSGNLSRSGMRRGYEAGLVASFSKPLLSGEKGARKAVREFGKWFDELWTGADECNAVLLEKYESIYEKIDNLRNPSPTDDDVAPSESSRNQLSPSDLRKLRVCKHFWIEAGNITHNLGPGKPGNQLMMKRLSRVFFGVPPVDVPQNSPLTHLLISYAGNSPWDCSLTFSDNGMDKLTLPAPGASGPPAYDNENLLFTRVSPGRFVLQLGSNAEKAAWKKRSSAIGTLFSMTGSPRVWGVF